MDERDAFGQPRRRNPAAFLIVAILAFVGGGLAMGYGVRNWDRLAAIVRPATPPVRIVAVPRPVVPAMPPHVPARTDPETVARIDALDDKVDTIESQAREATGNADRAEGLLVAFAARRLVDRGEPLGYLEAMLRNHFGGVEPQAVAMVIASAQRPVTLDQLQRDFLVLWPSLVAAPVQQSWWQGFRRELGSIFVIRRTNTPSALPDDRRERARLALEQGHVDVAMAEVMRLPGASKAGEWIASARRYVRVHNALDRVETAALLAPPPSLAAPVVQKPLMRPAP